MSRLPCSFLSIRLVVCRVCVCVCVHYKYDMWDSHVVTQRAVAMVTSPIHHRISRDCIRWEY